MANKLLTTWKTVAQETAIVTVDDGDITIPLARVPLIAGMNGNIFVRYWRMTR